MSNDRMPWFKWWDGTAADLKFRMVAEDCKLPVACIVGAWAYLLEHASRSTDRGSIADVDLELMAYTLQLPDLETVCNAMKRRKLLHDDGTITKWEDRQAKRERNEVSGSSTERVQRMRAKQKAEREASQNKDLPPDPAAVDDTGQDCNDVTHVTPRNAMKRPKKKNREEEEKERKPKPSSSSGDDGVTPFEQFWDAYPWKAGKQDAEKAWAKIKPAPALVLAMLAAIAAQLEGADWKRENGQYIPRAATWLNGGRWKDQVRPYVAPPVKLPAGWWETPAGMKAAGLMLTPPLEPRSGEYPKDFAQRIRAALGQVDAPGTSAAQVAPPVGPPGASAEPYVPPALKEGEQLTDEERQARRDELREAMKSMNEKAGNARAGVASANASDRAA